MTEGKTIYNNTTSTPQEIYDSYNKLVFSSDTRVIQKLLIKNNIYNRIKHLNGDIVECGVFKGASVALWLQLIKLHEYNSVTSVIGFDFFDKKELLENLSDTNKSLMSNVVERGQYENDIKKETILNKL